MEDVNYNISLAIKDISSLINYCSTDKKARNLCTKRSFWQEQFNRFRLPLDDHIQYDNSYEWIQLLLKTKIVTETLDKLNIYYIYKGSHMSVKLKHNILLTSVLNSIKKKSKIDVSDLKPYFDYNYDYENNDDFMQGLKDNYPFMINEIVMQRYSDKYKLSLIMNKNIENMPGGVEILRDSDEIVFGFNVKKYELENIIINLIPYF